jgi:hypothetical protein
MPAFNILIAASRVSCAYHPPFFKGFCLARLRLICLPTYLAPSSVAGRAQRHFCCSLIAKILYHLLAPLL